MSKTKVKKKKTETNTEITPKQFVHRTLKNSNGARIAEVLKHYWALRFKEIQEEKQKKINGNFEKPKEEFDIVAYAEKLFNSKETVEEGDVKLPQSSAEQTKIL